MTDVAPRSAQDRTVHPSFRRLIALLGLAVVGAGAGALRQVDGGWVAPTVIGATGLMVLVAVFILRWKVERLVLADHALTRVNMLGRTTVIPVPDLVRATFVSVRYASTPVEWVVLERTSDATPVKFDAKVWNPAELRRFLAAAGVEIRTMDETISANEFRSLFPGLRESIWERRPVLSSVTLTVAIAAVVFAAFGVVSLLG